MREWAVNSKPWFLAAKFREAAEVLKTERIKLPADANLEVDDKLFPPPCLAKLNHGRNVQEVAAAPPGRPRRRRIIPNRRCGNCNQPGHTKSKCNRHIPWFDWSNPEHLLFQEAYTRSIPRAVRVDFALLFLSTLFSNLPKMGKKRAKRMMRQSEFSIKNQYNAFKSHHYHHLFVFDRFFSFNRLYSSVIVT